MKLIKSLLLVAVALTISTLAEAQKMNLSKPSTTSGAIGTSSSITATTDYYMRMNPVSTAFAKGDKKYVRVDLAVTKVSGTVGATIKMRGSGNGTDWEYLNDSDSILVTNTTGRKAYSKTFTNSGYQLGFDYYQLIVTSTTGSYTITGTCTFW